MSKKRKSAPASDANASAPSTSPLPDQLCLALDVSGEMAKNPNEALRDAAHLERVRRLGRLRQKRCRANKKLSARIAQAEAAGNTLTAEERNRFEERKGWSDEKFLEWMRAQMLLWGAIQIGGPLATRVFEAIEPRYFDAPFDLVFVTARALHGRGQRVTRLALLRELKESGVILLYDRELRWFDGIMESPLVPRLVTEQQIDEGVECLKQA